MPSSISKGDIVQILPEQRVGEKIVKAIKTLEREFEPDFIMVDTHPGLSEEVLVALETVDILLNVVRPDNQDYQGLEVTSSIAKKFDINNFVILNKVHQKLRNVSLKKKVENRFKIKVAGMIPLSEEIVLSQSQYVFFDKYPKHAVSREIQIIAQTVFGIKKREHLELMHHILLKISKNKNTKMDKTMFKNVYIRNQEKYLKDLIRKDFVEENRGLYSITKKGTQFLAKYKVINKFVKDFRI